MKIFDGHADMVWCFAKMEKSIVRDHHLERFKLKYNGGIFIAYLDENAVDEEKKWWMINSTIHEIKQNDLYNIIKLRRF